MSPQRIHPNIRFEFWVSDRDVTSHSFGEATTGEVAKDKCHVNEDMATMGVVCGEGGDTWGGEVLVES